MSVGSGVQEAMDFHIDKVEGSLMVLFFGLVVFVSTILESFLPTLLLTNHDQYFSFDPILFSFTGVGQIS